MSAQITKDFSQQAQVLMDELQHEETVVEKNGIKVVIKGNQKITSILTNGKTAEYRLLDALNEAIQKTQEAVGKKVLGGE